MQVHGLEHQHVQGHSAPVLGNSTIGVGVRIGLGFGRTVGVGVKPGIMSGMVGVGVGVNPGIMSGMVGVGTVDVSQVRSMAFALLTRTSATMTRIAKAMYAHMSCVLSFISISFKIVGMPWLGSPFARG